MAPEDFVGYAFAVRTAAHQAHLRTKSYAQHIALGEFYDGIVDLADAFAEVWQGLNEERLPAFDDCELPTGDALTFLRDFLDCMTSKFSKITSSDPSLENIVADMRTLTARALYKLKFLGA